MTFSVTGESSTAHTSPWTPRVATQLAVLAAAAFIYVTAEMLPVGALPAIATDLQVSEGLVATLMASYALVAALTTVAPGTPHRALAATPDPGRHPGVPDRVPGDLGARAQLRGAGRRPGAVRAGPWADVVGDRTDRGAIGPCQSRRQGYRRGLCGHRSGPGGGQSARRGAQRGVGLAALPWRSSPWPRRWSP